MTAFSAEGVPTLPRGVRLRHDTARGQWVVMAPERVFVPDPIALAVLNLVDGQRDVAAICADLAARYDAPLERIAADVAALLAELAGKGVIAPAA
jgi:pyrroloquinoline quinone biosynthesis protein D